MHVFSKYNGKNNGLLEVTETEMKAIFGWHKDKLRFALRELRERGWLRVTMQGGPRNGPRVELTKEQREWVEDMERPAR